LEFKTFRKSRILTKREKTIWEFFERRKFSKFKLSGMRELEDWIGNISLDQIIRRKKFFVIFWGLRIDKENSRQNLEGPDLEKHESEKDVG